MLALYLRIQNALYDLTHREEGQGLAEYALILALVAIAAITVLSSLGDEISEVFSEVVSELEGR